MNEDARKIFVRNFQYQLEKNGKTQADIVRELGFKQPTVSDWAMGKKYPRVDKMQILADYFNIMMSDLTEEKPTYKGGLSAQKQAFIDKVIQLDESQIRMIDRIVDSILSESGE